MAGVIGRFQGSRKVEEGVLECGEGRKGREGEGSRDGKEEEGGREGREEEGGREGREEKGDREGNKEEGVTRVGAGPALRADINPLSALECRQVVF